MCLYHLWDSYTPVSLSMGVMLLKKHRCVDWQLVAHHTQTQDHGAAVFFTDAFFFCIMHAGLEPLCRPLAVDSWSCYSSGRVNPERACKTNHKGRATHPYIHAPTWSTTSTSHRMRADNLRELICMRNGVDIYLNLISFPHTVHCRLLCQSHINPLIS